MPRIEPAIAPDLESLCELLEAVNLPTEGLREHLGTALVARDGDDVVGCVALEVYGDTALLRSLAVVPSRRGTGLGRHLAQAALSLGRQGGVRTFCLLTTTAPDFFVRHFAFRPVARDAVPVAVRQSVEFVSACPATAQALMWPFDDPSRVQGSEELQLAAFRRTRDEIDARLREWLRSN